MPPKIPFCQPTIIGTEVDHIKELMKHPDGFEGMAYSHHCSEWLCKNLGARQALMTHTCTAAIEMAALLIEVGPGDEVVMPSYTFVSTANAFVLRGATPVFVDVDASTQNLDANLVEAAITTRTKAIVAVHYAGISCDMDRLLAIARSHRLILIEDAAQALLSSYQSHFLGTVGDLGCLSFHYTKNIHSGEGGALLVNNPDFAERAEIIRDKGTNRGKYLRSEIAKYSWVDLGSSYAMSEIACAFLLAQLDRATQITKARRHAWQNYMLMLAQAREHGQLVASLPVVTPGCRHNGHAFYLILETECIRKRFLEEMRKLGIQCAFHYVPLHSSLFGQKACRTHGSLGNTDRAGQALVRLPLWLGIERVQSEIIEATLHILGSC